MMGVELQNLSFPYHSMLFLFITPPTTRVAPLVAQMVKNHQQCRRPCFDLWIGKIPWRREPLPTPEFLSEESPWTEEPGRLQSMESQRVGHIWATFTFHSVPGKGLAQNRFLVNILTALINGRYANLAHSSLRGLFLCHSWSWRQVWITTEFFKWQPHWKITCL